MARLSVSTTTNRPTAPTTAGSDPLALAWHDETCPEGEQCRSRSLHAMSAAVVSSGILRNVVRRVTAVDAGELSEAGQLDALASGSVVVDTLGHPFTKGGAAWWCVCGDEPTSWGSAELLEECTEGPLRLVWRAPVKTASVDGD